MGVLLFVLVLVFGVLVLKRSMRERTERRARAATVRLEVDAWGVRRWLADGRYEEVGWDELQEVRAVILPKGPWGSRLRFVLDGGGERGCIVDVENADSSGLISRIAALPGFDHRKLAEVVDSTRTGTDVLWARTTT